MTGWWCDRLLRPQAETCKRGGERAMKQIWRVALRRNYASSHASLPSVRHRAGTARTGNLLLASIRSAYYPACRGAVLSSRRLGGVAAMHFSTTTSCSATEFGSSAEEPVFRPRRALVLTKFSRYEFEKRRHAHLTEEQLVQDVSLLCGRFHFVVVARMVSPRLSNVTRRGTHRPRRGCCAAAG